MLKNEFDDFSYFTLDDFDTIEMIRSDPVSIFINDDFIIVDEAQKLPEIFNAVKLAVDNDKNKRVIIISGSSKNPLVKYIKNILFLLMNILKLQ